MTLCRRPSRSWSGARVRRSAWEPSSEGHPTLPNGSSSQGPLPPKAPPSELGAKLPGSRSSPSPQSRGSFWTHTVQKEPRPGKPGRDPDPVVPFGPRASIRNHAIDALVPCELPERGRGLVPRELLERREPWSLGELPRDRERRDLGSSGPGLARRRLLRCEARGRSRWEGWGDPLTKAMRGRYEPSPRPQLRDGLRQRVTPPLRTDPRTLAVPRPVRARASSLGPPNPPAF